jgi:hypothetical protein
MILKSRFKSSAITFGLTLATSTLVAASPWIDTHDPYLKASITALANGGIIKSPINTYPLMYKSIAADLKAAHGGKIPEHLAYALKHVEHALMHGQKTRTSGVKVKLASDNDDFQSFGQRYGAKGELNLFNEVLGDKWAFKSSVHFTTDAYNNKKRSFEGSYLAGILGNWVVSVDQLSSWWGPGNDSTMALSNNAVAFPAVRLTRHSTDPIDLPVLRWLGPVGMTTYFGQQEHSNTLKNIRTWGWRLNFKPFESLEVGLTRTTQWGGSERPKGFSTFTDLLLGTSDNTSIDGTITTDNEPGNQLAGFDLKWHTNLFDRDFGLYAELIGEDESGALPSHVMYQLGMETSFGDQQGLYHLFAEYTDTFVNCNGDPTSGNCAYEHHIYTEGYRRYGRSMGNTYDSDAQVLTFGLSRAELGGVSWFGKMKLMKLNKDGQDHWSGPHPISVGAQDRLQLEAGYQLPMFNGLLNVQGTLYHSQFETTGGNNTSGSLKAGWEYRF